jgi:glycosyltransferase involved in cell wall biosynthesis
MPIIGIIYRQIVGIIKLLLPKTLYVRLRSISREVLSIKPVHNIDLSLPMGINLVGYLRMGMGLGEGVRLLLESIKEIGIPVSLFDFKTNNISSPIESRITRKYSVSPLYRTTIVHVNPDQYKLFETDLPRSLWKRRYIIGFLLWELPRIPDAWFEGIKLLDEVWTPSRYISDIFRSQLTIPVRTIPYGIPCKLTVRENREFFGLDRSRFYFLVMYDIASVMERKNPRGAIEAFIRAFAPNDERVGIVVKINNSSYAPNELASLKLMLSAYPSARFIEKTLVREEVDSLIFSCDTVISLHRSEGFGLVLAEAMSFSKPIIATNWSANTEFMDESNSCPVSYKLVPLEKDYRHYRAEQGNYWAEPDLDHAAALMRRLVDDSEYRYAIGVKARDRINADLSPEASGLKIATRLKELGLWE